MRSFLMKSFASSEISSKAASLKSYSAITTFDIVSMSVSPMNGDRPDKLTAIQRFKFGANMAKFQKQRTKGNKKLNLN